MHSDVLASFPAFLSQTGTLYMGHYHRPRRKWGDTDSGNGGVDGGGFGEFQVGFHV